MRSLRSVVAVLALLAVPASAAAAPPQPANPSFTDSAASWTAAPSVARDTETFDSWPAAGQWGSPAVDLAAGDSITTPFVGSFWPGVTYVLRFAYRGDGQGFVTVAFGQARKNLFVVDGCWCTATISWTPMFAMSSSLKLTFTSAASRSVPLRVMHVDSFSVATGVIA